MTFDELKDACDGLFAYDTGCVSSGIHDPLLKENVRSTLTALDANEYRVTVSRLVREMWLSEGSIEQGYGYEDAQEFIQWITSLVMVGWWKGL